MGKAQTTPTNLGPIRTTFQDYVQQSAPLANPPSGACRAYFISGVITYLNSSGASCGPSVGSCPNCVVTDGGGNASIAGNFTALELILSGAGPLDLVTPCNTVSSPPSTFGLLGMGAGCVPVIYPGTLSAVVPIAYQDGFGNVYQNANTATALKTTPAQCSGQYATGVQADGTANCSSSTYVLLPTISDPGAVASSLSLFGTTSQVQAHINGGSLVTLLRKDTNYATWTCPVAGGGLIPSTGTSQYCNWTLPTGITVVGYDLAVSVLPVTCSTYAVVQVWDATASAEVGSYSITLDPANAFPTQVTGSSNIATGHLLRMKVTTAPVGCSGTNTNTGGNVIATVTYQML